VAWRCAQIVVTSARLTCSKQVVTHLLRLLGCSAKQRRPPAASWNPPTCPPPLCFNLAAGASVFKMKLKKTADCRFHRLGCGGREVATYAAADDGDHLQVETRSQVTGRASSWPNKFSGKISRNKWAVVATWPRGFRCLPVKKHLPLRREIGGSNSLEPPGTRQAARPAGGCRCRWLLAALP